LGCALRIPRYSAEYTNEALRARTTRIMRDLEELVSMVESTPYEPRSKRDALRNMLSILDTMRTLKTKGISPLKDQSDPTSKTRRRGKSVQVQDPIPATDGDGAPTGTKGPESDPDDGEYEDDA
jgi:hypothetical protein